MLRIYAAVSHLDISHPDEHFQTLEPASHVIYGFGWLSWEWTTGTRSWLVPALYMPLIWVFKILGFNGGVAPITACRVLMAVLSTFTLYEFWILLVESGMKRWASLVAISFFALSPACVAWGAMTLSDLWAMIFLWCALPYVLRSIRNGKKSGSRRCFARAFISGEDSNDPLADRHSRGSCVSSPFPVEDDSLGGLAVI